MSDPIFFLSHFRIKEGRFDAVRQLTSEVSAQLPAEKASDGPLPLIHRQGPRDD